MLNFKVWIITIILMTFCASAQNFSAQLTVKDSTHQIQLTFGMDPLASDSFDVGLDLLAPPPPPSGAFDARLTFNNVDYLIDYRQSTTDTTVYRINYAAAQGEAPIVLSWDNSQLAQWGHFTIVDDISGNLFGPVDMLSVDSLIADDPTIQNGLRIVVVAYSPLDPPQNLSAVAGNQSVQLSWSAPQLLKKASVKKMSDDKASFLAGIEADFTGQSAKVESAPLGYKIYRSENNLQFNNIDSVDAGQLTYTDTGLENDSTYYYYVTAVYVNGESAPSDTVAATPQGVSILFEEVFGDTLPPTGWQVLDNDGSGSAWEFQQAILFTSGDTVLPQTGQSFWFSNFNNANSSGLIDEWLISPQIPAANFDELTFYAGAIGGSFPDSLKLLISTTGTNPSDFVEVAYVQVPGPTGSWHEFTFDISAFSGSPIYFAVNYYIVDGGPTGSNSDNVWVDHFIITGDQPVGISDSEEVPNQFELAQNYPNPFNPGTTIRYALPYQAEVRLEIYNALGQLVKVLVNKSQTAGIKTVNWNGTNQFGEPVSSGVYLYRLKAGNHIQTRKMMLLK